MVNKRQPPREPESDGDFTASHRRFKRTQVARSVVENLTSGLTFNEPLWEQFFRRVVREEVERAVFPYLNASSSRSAHQAGPSEGGSGLQLLFVGQLPPTLFTGSKIETEDPEVPDSVLRIILVDTSTQSIVKTGPLSSIKIEIVALNGEFGSLDDHDDWTQMQFNDNVQREREGRRPLVAGELTVILVDGVGVVRNISFTDNSSWTRSRKFRLGARKVSPAGGERIREARSVAFIVKDHRGELYKKNHPPHQNDEVWRLEKIAKDGKFHKRLAERGINNVKDFVCQCVKDPSLLRMTLGKISKKTWSAIVDHAANCVVDDNKFYMYRTSADPHNVTVIFNSVHKVVRAGFNGHFLSPDQFTPSHMSVVQNLTQHVYKNESVLVPLDELSLPGPAWPLAEPLNNPSPTMEPQIECQPWHNNDQAMVAPQPPTHPVGSELSHHLPVSNNPQFIFPQTQKNSYSREYFLDNFELGSGGGWSTGGSSQMPIIQTNHLNPEDVLRFQANTNIDHPWSDDQATTEFFFASNNNYNPAEAGIFPVMPGFVRVSRRGKGKARWCKIRAFFNMLSIKNRARTRRMLGY